MRSPADYSLRGKKEAHMESSVVAPAIVIAVTDECSEQWRDVLLGIEEEGIPFVLQPQTGGDLVHHAWQAAQRSPLQVGIACDRERLIVHYKNLPASTPLFSLMYHQNRLARRNTGNNAARLVKGIPFRDRNA
ncbi:propanediol dehydratase [Klebsiella pneumoniae]|uniref:Propanediol dehydratase n=4 Tax=Enterobacteriaceae TaxID=543 RepID=A0A422Z655_KLEPN|nr:propanediol dehydratase [Klebsiella pneumoniae]OVI20444.1 propanediol dehydratase [Klebsiella pneumoniae]OVJ68210.1 propanediol dehydratase [Klebsiella pneumoniae]ROG81626.1 propanediol dehydratase [Klebsiella pneumoniae]RRF69042.1 propanediol dehydratase [Klebsiella pneumoniae]